MNKDIPIVCINLERATERRAMIEREWINDRGCPVHFIEAYDRRRIDAGELLFDYDPTAAVNYMKRSLTSGEIACATSHALAINYAKENNLEHIVIIEDDVIPLFKDYNEFNNVLSYLDTEYPQPCIAMLHCEFLALPYKFKEKKQYFNQVSRPTYGTWAYYLPSALYDTFLKDLLSYRAPADWHWKNYTATNQLVAASSPLAYHASLNTYIGNEHRGKLSHRIHIE